jgi:serine/threonine protein kinase
VQASILQDAPRCGQLSDACADFVRLCLCKDALQRPTALQLTRHPWLHPYATLPKPLPKPLAVQPLSRTAAAPVPARASPPLCAYVATGARDVASVASALPPAAVQREGSSDTVSGVLASALAGSGSLDNSCSLKGPAVMLTDTASMETQGSHASSTCVSAPLCMHAEQAAGLPARLEHTCIAMQHALHAQELQALYAHLPPQHAPAAGWV